MEKNLNSQKIHFIFITILSLNYIEVKNLDDFDNYLQMRYDSIDLRNLNINDILIVLILILTTIKSILRINSNLGISLILFEILSKKIG